VTLPRPLEDIVVVAVEQAVAAPYATRQLADLGARVIKIERPGTGDFARRYDDKVNGLSSAFLWLNRGKESFALDIRSDEGAATLERLLGRCDVFIHNLSPAAAARAGLDTRSVQARHPSVIACGISGYGLEGPLADAKAYDLLIQGETGMIALSGTPEHMAKVGISIADISAGSQAYASILAAIRHRDRTGTALPVDISLFDSLTEWLGYPLYYTIHGGKAPARRGTDHATIAPYGAFTTAGGDQVLIAVQNDAEWSRFCAEVLGDAGLATDPRYQTHALRVDNREALDATISTRFAQLDQQQAFERLREADIASARLNGIAALADHEQLASRDRWTDTATPAGTVRTLLPPWSPGPPGQAAELGAVPELGEHTEQLREWLRD
jgi:formyl-CoA transferase